MRCAKVDGSDSEERHSSTAPGGSSHDWLGCDLLSEKLLARFSVFLAETASTVFLEMAARSCCQPHVVPAANPIWSVLGICCRCPRSRRLGWESNCGSGAVIWHRCGALSAALFGGNAPVRQDLRNGVCNQNRPSSAFLPESEHNGKQ